MWVGAFKMINSTNDPKTKKCDLCGLYLSFSEFHKNKAKKDGLQNRCKECIYSLKKKIKAGVIKPQHSPPIKRDFFYIPDIYLVGVGRTQIYQHCCLDCEAGFFSDVDIRSYADLFCDDCSPDMILIPERNKSNINYIGNVVGWKVKVENVDKRRSHRNYKRCYIRDEYTRQYCGYNMKNATKFLALHIDHIKPWSSQGGNGLNNLVVACQECNCIASDKVFDSFRAKMNFIRERRTELNLARYSY
jgi:5-methylcytosine-specific restriction endonuclease McrA